MRLTVHVFVVIDHNHCARALFLCDAVFARMDFVRLFRRRFARFRRVVCFLVGDAERRVVVDAGDVPDSQRRIVGAREQPSVDDLHGGKQNINLNNPAILCSCVAVLMLVILRTSYQTFKWAYTKKKKKSVLTQCRYRPTDLDYNNAI